MRRRNRHDDARLAERHRPDPMLGGRRLEPMSPDTVSRGSRRSSPPPSHGRPRSRALDLPGDTLEADDRTRPGAADSRRDLLHGERPLARPVTCTAVPPPLTGGTRASSSPLESSSRVGVLAVDRNPDRHRAQRLVQTGLLAKAVECIAHRGAVGNSSSTASRPARSRRIANSLTRDASSTGIVNGADQLDLDRARPQRHPRTPPARSRVRPPRASTSGCAKPAGPGRHGMPSVRAQAEGARTAWARPRRLLVCLVEHRRGPAAHRIETHERAQGRADERMKVTTARTGLPGSRRQAPAPRSPRRARTRSACRAGGPHPRRAARPRAPPSAGRT